MKPVSPDRLVTSSAPECEPELCDFTVGRKFEPLKPLHALLRLGLARREIGPPRPIVRGERLRKIKSVR
jgi:hypothetical protein